MKNRISIPDTDLAFHPLGLGTVNAGLTWDEADADRIFDAFLDMGGSIIDTAHVYSDWVKPERARSERVVGDWLARGGKRDRVVLVTKGGHPDMMTEHPDTHMSRMKEADQYCRERGCRGFIANQALYNLGYRYMNPMDDDTLVCADEEMQQYHREHTGNLLMPYMGVCSGFFHKYAAGGTDAVKTSPYCTEGNLKMAERVKMLCEKYNATVTQAVLGFFGQQDFDCAPLYGPKNAEQIIEAMKTWDIPFKKEDYMAE